MHIYPIHDQAVTRKEKESLLHQRGQVFWLTGLSGSGKSTIALAVEKRLTQEEVLVALLDGDNVRDGLCKDLGFSPEDRQENIRRISEMAKIMVQNGLVVLCSFISPEADMRELAEDIIGGDDFHLVHIEASVAVCQDRDPKGLYKKALSGEIKNFTGISAPFDVPVHPSLTINTEENSIERNSETLYHYIKKHIQL